MTLRNIRVRRIVLRTQQFLVGASVLGGCIWGSAEIGRPVIAFLTAIGVQSPASWPQGTSSIVVHGDLLLTRILAGSAAIALGFGALYALVRLCLWLGAVVFELVGARTEPSRHLCERDGRN